MTLPTTIAATVSPQAIGKVGRLFNGSPTDVLHELLQNARRAGATRVDIDLLDFAGHPTLAVRDDGRGIDHPRMLVTLGESDWDTRTERMEDPAGMGVFSMAGLRVEYRSFSSSAEEGWRVIIEPDAWSSGRLLAIEPFDIAAGTEILIDMPVGWDRLDLDRIVAKAAEHYPLPVRFCGKNLPRADWLQGAVRVEDWEGSRIGIYCHAPRSHNGDTLNFHGLTVPCVLPAVSEVDGGRQWSARVDIGDTPALQLVLPARKEPVQNAMLAALKQACRAAMLQTIADAGEHRLAFGDYAEARSLGIAIGEAAPHLFAWTAPTADWGDVGEQGKRTRGTMVRIGDQPPPVAQTLARALELAGEDAALRLVEVEPKFEGYRWYDALAAVSDVRIAVTTGGSAHVLREGDETALEQGRVDAIHVELEVEGSDRKRTETLVSDVALWEVDGGWSGVESVTLWVGADATITQWALVDLLMRASFSPSDDSDADSWETQRDAARRDAVQLARTILVSEDAALIGRALDRVEDNIKWLVPDGRTLLISVSRTEAIAVFRDDPVEAGDEIDFTHAIERLACAVDTDPTTATDMLHAIRAACTARRRSLLTVLATGHGQEGRGKG